MNRIHFLLSKKIQHKCSEEEECELARLILESKDEELNAQLKLLWDEFTPTEAMPDLDAKKLFRLIEMKTTAKPVKRRKTRVATWITAAAAVLLLIVSIDVLFFFNKPERKTLEKPLIINAQNIPSFQKAPFIRSIILPDGSRVLLRSGAILKYGSDFNKKERCVELLGEAFFDIKHDRTRQFKIKSGDLNIVVLGTAFDVKAWQNQEEIHVAVTRGKVRVEKDKKVLALLTKNQFMSYNTERSDFVQKEVIAKDVVDQWAREDLVFENVTVKSVVTVLSNRFGCDIVIENQQIANSLVVLKFEGTETLENMLEVLCVITKNRYKKENNRISIERI